MDVDHLREKRLHIFGPINRCGAKDLPCACALQQRPLLRRRRYGLGLDENRPLGKLDRIKIGSVNIALDVTQHLCRRTVVLHASVVLYIYHCWRKWPKSRGLEHLARIAVQANFAPLCGPIPIAKPDHIVPATRRRVPICRAVDYGAEGWGDVLLLRVHIFGRGLLGEWTSVACGSPCIFGERLRVVQIGGNESSGILGRRWIISIVRGQRISSVCNKLAEWCRNQGNKKRNQDPKANRNQTESFRHHETPRMSRANICVLACVTELFRSTVRGSPEFSDRSLFETPIPKEQIGFATLRHAL